MKVIFLGSGGSVPTKDRGLPAVLVEYLNELFLFDCGEGTLRQIMICSSKRNGKNKEKNEKINFMNINKIFITHFHADHIAGLTGILNTMNFLGRNSNLEIYGGIGIRNIIKNLPVPKDAMQFVKIYEISEGQVVEGRGYKIIPFKTQHISESLGFVFEEKEKRKFLKEKALALGIPEGKLYSELQRGESINFNGKVINADDVLSQPIKGRKIVYTGDTTPCDNTIKFADDCDILIHDSTYSNIDIDKISDHGHTTALQAAETAKNANAKSLFLIHISQRYPDSKILENEAREVFKSSYVVKDFMSVQISAPPEKKILIM
ncbi:MAG: ribonuclease Z [Candidatus Altiarchaeales archaeon HGW-Altiarchaeales-1]|nr:MAG: ribonuclease Z [Candidatus Altiarchaeales archaeon HGW-Altiarchaeales-1]